MSDNPLRELFSRRLRRRLDGESDGSNPWSVPQTDGLNPSPPRTQARSFREAFIGGPREQLVRALQTRGDVNAGQGQALGDGGSDQEQSPVAPNSQILTPQNQAAITRPRRTYNTTLSPADEQKFAEWKQQNAPNDTGEDYDLRGAFRAGLSPAANGHWADTFKKPNHPTFSNESQYAVGADAAKAGSWNGEQFVPPPATNQQSPFSFRDRFMQGMERPQGKLTGNDLPEQGGYAGNDPRRERITELMRNSINAPQSQSVPAGDSQSQSPSQSPNFFRAAFSGKAGTASRPFAFTRLAPTTDNPFALPQQQQQQDNQPLIRPRRAEISGAPQPDASNPNSEAAGASRVRRTQPRDYVADDEQYLRDLQNSKTTKTDKFMKVMKAVAIATGADPRTLSTPRERRIEEARQRVADDLAISGGRARIDNQQASTLEKLNKPPAASTRIVDEGEYSGVPAGTEIRQVWNGRDYVDDIGGNGKPRIAKSPPAERAAAKEIKYNSRGQAMLVPKDGGRATPIFQEDGTPLTKQANESGNVQIAYRLEPDGITQVQIERDAETGDWKDSLGPDKKPIIRGQVGRIDPNTGAPMSAVITNQRLGDQQQQASQQNQQKRQSYEGEAQEWGVKEQTYRKNKTAEDQAIRDKTAQLQALNTELEAAGSYGAYFKGGRSKTEINADITRLKKEIETHRTNASHFQSEADKAASAATVARRNAGQYVGGSQQRRPQGVIGRPPAEDGKHHYTTSEIRKQAKESHVTYESLLKKLKANPNAVIDQ